MAPPPTAPPVVLSPFTVTSDGDTGYLAQNSLSGSRLNTSLADLAAPVSAFTAEFIEDVGLRSVDELVVYMPSAELTYQEANTADFTGDAAAIRVRGPPATATVNYLVHSESFVMADRSGCGRVVSGGLNNPRAGCSQPRRREPTPLWSGVSPPRLPPPEQPCLRSVRDGVGPAEGAGCRRHQELVVPCVWRPGLSVPADSLRSRSGDFRGGTGGRSLAAGRPETRAAWVPVAHAAHGLHRAEAGGAQGEGATLAQHDDRGGVRAVPPPFADAYTKVTRALGRLIVDLVRFMTMSDVAGWLDLSWDTIKTVVQRRLEKDYRRIGYRHVRHIAIDEIYLGRTHKFVTLVVDLDQGRIIWVGDGRGTESLREFWHRYNQSGGRLRAVAMDMSGAYAASVRTHAPHAVLTFDRFHVIKLMNERLDDLRRELVREAGGEAGKSIKGLRWLLLHRKDNLEPDAAKRLEQSLRLNEPLQCAYLLKEELGLLWMQPDGSTAWAFLREWAAKAKASGIRQLQAMAGTLLREAKGILADYKTRLTSGKMEGINRKIRGLPCSVFGFRDRDFLKLRLYALHEAKFNFVG